MAAQLLPGAPGRARPWSTRTTVLAALGCALLAVLTARATGPAGGALNTVAGEGLLLLAVAAGAVAAVRRRRSLGAVGGLLVGASGAALTGDLTWIVNTEVLHREAYPDWPEAFYLLAYALLLGAGALLVRRRSARRDPSALIDAAVVTVGLAVVVQCFVVADRLGGSGDPPVVQLLGVLYPALDVLVLGLVARLLIGARSGRAPLVLLVLAMLSYLLGDLLFTGLVLAESYEAWQPWINALYALFNLFVPLALWHPDAERLCERTDAGPGRLGAGRAVALAVAGLLAPATLLTEHFTDGDEHVVAVAAGGALLFALTLLRMLLLVRAVEGQRALLEVQARTDALTGLANRRTYDHRLQRALAAGDGAPLSAGLVDLDRFKQYNDTHGHAAGDELLRAAAEAWSAELARSAPGACLARYGGEEFALLLPGLDAQEAADVVRRMLAVTPLGQSFSAGVVGWDGTAGARELLQRADERLYRAKAAGRARVLA
ncbi:GGDEF domain-containing protein [Kineococcus sp. SYSU DK005]|uniref:GGDEF domain-containing protein n=1 Tax=Kineococcus sp. SYSU DK005 TaxID=3383126 RepID=UPI003D7E5F2D